MKTEERARRLVYNVANSLGAETPRGPQLEKAAKETLRHVREAQREAEAETRATDKAAIPSNWLDPLLSGDDGLLVPAGCPEIEKLLNELRERIDTLSSAYGDPP